MRDGSIRRTAVSLLPEAGFIPFYSRGPYLGMLEHPALLHCSTSPTSTTPSSTTPTSTPASAIQPFAAPSTIQPSPIAAIPPGPFLSLTTPVSTIPTSTNSVPILQMTSIQHELAEAQSQIRQLKTFANDLICGLDKLATRVDKLTERSSLYPCDQSTMPGRLEPTESEDTIQGRNDNVQTPPSSIGQDLVCPHPHCAHKPHEHVKLFNLERHFWTRMAPSSVLELAVITLS